MAKKKVYAVKKGKQTGLFYSWNECKESVSGYPGAEYKGFETEEEAKNYLENRIQEIKKVDIEENTTNQLVVYVDGSFDEKIHAHIQHDQANHFSNENNIQVAVQTARNNAKTAAQRKKR